MAYKLKRKDTVIKRIQLKVPGDNDTTTDADLAVEYKRLGIKKFKEDGARLDSGDLSAQDWLADVIVNIEGIKDELGGEIQYAPNILESLLDEPFIFGPIAEGAKEVQQDSASLARKN